MGDDNEIYIAAMKAAMHEYDALWKVSHKINRRLSLLRQLINCASNLVGIDVNEEYQYKKQSQKSQR